ncbi:MAG: hydroxymethylpyrimidine/phosphomethylpyrimidine kinase [Bacteroidota bacterium]|nr:hydroxymethylpyrimidine/phosphomethylpyrimidine kinase [Bacteroidota bacterium]
MQTKPNIVSIAGFDPSGGAGILADIKTIEANGGYGLGVLSANTWQNDIAFRKTKWVALHEMQEQISILLERLSVQHFKIGLIESMDVLLSIIQFIKQRVPDALIVWDPILKASAGFEFHSTIKKEKLSIILNEISCITPNLPEAKKLFGEELSTRLVEVSHTCAVYLKGGHAAGKEKVTDILFMKGTQFTYQYDWLIKGEKHGSGCVLSAALITQLAKHNDIVQAAAKASAYTHQFLASNETLLGYHSSSFIS